MKGKDVLDIGYVTGPVIGLALKLYGVYRNKKKTLQILKRILKNPKKYKKDSNDLIKEIASILSPDPIDEILLNELPCEINIFGEEDIDKAAIDQIINIAKLPISVSGALMPDSHLGYTMPIGGVIALENSIMPASVGVDIGCRMALTIYDENPNIIKNKQSKFKKSLIDHTAFGLGAAPDRTLEDPVMDDKLFDEIKFVKGLKDVAAIQIGSSGGGNHFVEWGYVEIFENSNLGIKAGEYLALLTHSGSRGFGAKIAKYYTTIAQEQCKLEQKANYLAYLDLNSEAGQEYWLAMNLAGDYAAACHDHIHRKLQKAMGIKEILRIENHHNFAWKEKLNDKDVIVHRKGATPAQNGVLGIIPGSMLDPGYIVRGKGYENSINSASHGAGRQMSRRQGNDTFTMGYIKKMLRSANIELIGGGPDEAPGVYKDIEKVMEYQTHLVDKLGRFYPKIVRMA